MSAAPAFLGPLLGVAALAATFLAVTTLVYLACEPSARWARRRVAQHADWIVSELDSQFLFLSRGRARLLIAAAPVLAAVAGFVLTRSVVLTAGAMVLGAVAPRWVVQAMRRRRVRAFGAQLADTLRLAASGMRAGLSLPQALDLVAREMPPPMKDEIGLVLREHSVGVPLDTAIEGLGRRMPIDDVRIVVGAITTLREVGANVTEAFDTIVETILERKKVDDKIKAATAEGVFQGYLVSAFPFVLAAVLYRLDPEFMRPLFVTPLGWTLLGVALGLSLLGLWAIHKIETIEV